MKKLLILAIALTFCLVIYVCIYYMLSAARVPVLTFSPGNEVEVCTLYPLCIQKTGTGIFIYPDELHLGGLHVGGPFEPAETPRPASAATPRPTSTPKIWQPPGTHTPTPLYPPTPMPTPTPPSYDLTIYLRGTNNAEGFAAFSGEHVNAGSIYTEGGYVYGEVAVQIGDNEYHFYQHELDSFVFDAISTPKVKFRFSDSLLRATRGVEPRFDKHSLRFWAGVLDCNSATDEPYKIGATLYEGEEIRRRTEISFLVADNPLCGVEAEEPEGIPIPTPRGRPRPP